MKLLDRAMYHRSLATIFLIRVKGKTIRGATAITLAVATTLAKRAKKQEQAVQIESLARRSRNLQEVLDFYVLCMFVYTNKNLERGLDYDDHRAECEYFAEEVNDLLLDEEFLDTDSQLVYSDEKYSEICKKTQWRIHDAIFGKQPSGLDKLNF